MGGSGFGRVCRSHVSEFVDPIFEKTSPNENERFRLVFAKTGSI
jgi:hypothetical protein